MGRSSPSSSRPARRTARSSAFGVSFQKNDISLDKHKVGQRHQSFDFVANDCGDQDFAVAPFREIGKRVTTGEFAVTRASVM